MFRRHVLDQQISVLTNFPILPSKGTRNIEVVGASDDEEEVESTLLPSAFSTVGGSIDGSIDCEIENVLRVLPYWMKPHMVYSHQSIKIQRVLGHGQYGTVHKGMYQHGSAV